MRHHVYFVGRNKEDYAIMYILWGEIMKITLSSLFCVVILDTGLWIVFLCDTAQGFCCGGEHEFHSMIRHFTGFKSNTLFELVIDNVYSIEWLPNNIMLITSIIASGLFFNLTVWNSFEFVAVWWLSYYHLVHYRFFLVANNGYSSIEKAKI